MAPVKKKVVHFTTVHPADDPRILYKECCSLASLGYEVVLLVKGKTFGNVDSVTIKSVGESKNLFIRLTWLQYKMLFSLLKERAQIYHFHDPELIFIGLILKLFSNKVIYDSHEDLPNDILSKEYLPKILKKPLSILSVFLNQMANYFFDRVVTVTDSIAHNFSKQKTTIIKNFPDTKLYSPPSLDEYKARKNFCTYLGSITKSRGSDQMFNIFHHQLFGKSTLLLAGNFSNLMTEQKFALNNQNNSVVYLGRINYLNTPEFLTRSKIGLLLLHPTIAFQESLPLKLFEYMAAGLPVIASDFPLWRSIILKANCGYLVNPLDEKEIADTIEFLLNNPDVAYQMGKNGREHVLEFYNWDDQKLKLLQVYESLSLKGNKSPCAE